MTGLTLGDYSILALLFGGPLTLQVFVLKGLHRRVDVVESRVRDLEKSKLGRIDWLREVGTTRRKMDALAEQLAAIGGRLDAEFGMRAVLGRLADAMTRLAEK